MNILIKYLKLTLLEQSQWMWTSEKTKIMTKFFSAVPLRDVRIIRVMLLLYICICSVNVLNKQELLIKRVSKRLHLGYGPSKTVPRHNSLFSLSFFFACVCYIHRNDLKPRHIYTRGGAKFARDADQFHGCQKDKVKNCARINRDGAAGNSCGKSQRLS